MNKLYIFILGFLVLSACTTQKKRSEQSAMKKAWHNTNAHYNGYFNANESIEESILILNEQHEDNYLKRLDVYEYVEVDNPQAVAAQLDEAVKKVAIVVNLHPYSQWSDDCYLLAGKALFLKQDYESAEKAFRFLIKEYPPQSKEDAKVARSSKKKSSKKSKSKTTKSKKSSSSSSSKAKTKKQRERDRRAYNKEVARKKKQRERDRKKGKTTSSRTPKNTAASEVETPKPTTPTTTPTPIDPDELPRVGLVSISGDTQTTGTDDGDQYKMKHRPAFQESQLWLARTLIERDNYNGARRILNQLEENTSTFKDVRRDAAIAQAHLSIKEEDYTLATAALSNAVIRSNDKEIKARLAFILGQLQQKLGNAAAAYAAYEQVVKFRPTYEMVFAAQLNMAQNAYLAGGGKEAEAMANLEKLLKDDKNNAYKDQIYFAMAQIALSQNNEEKGIMLIQQSLASNTSNRPQKAEAYYYLAEFFYAKESYLPAKLYYDSTLTLMAEADERYIHTKQLRDNLIDIASNLETISLQDSLLLIAEYTPEQRADLAKKLQSELNEEAKGESSSTGRDKFGRGLTQGRSTIGAGNPQEKNDFWAYDESARKRRDRAYKKKWGERVLEDNWRRSNSSDTSIEGVEAEVVDVNLLTQEQIDDILSDVPDSEGAKLASELKIKKAMFELGRLYKDRMENSEKCIEMLEKLNARFPGHLYEMDSWYYLYLAHTELGHTAQAKVYRDKIVQKYPSSNYGQILVNPNYAQEQLNEEFQLNKTYDEVYSLFEQGKHEEVLIQAEQNINRIIGKHVLKPRYALLKAMSTGHTKGKEAYIIELQKIIATYAESPEATRSKEILRLLGGTGASLPGGAEEHEGDFTVNESELHYVLIVFESDDIDLNANKITVSDYNKSYHSLDRIRISNVYLGEKNNVPVLVLRRFKNKDKAMEYYEGIQKNSSDFIDTATNSFQIFPITQSNYREVLRNRTVEGYGAFFQKNY